MRFRKRTSATRHHSRDAMMSFLLFTSFFFGRTIDHTAQYAKKIGDHQYAAQDHQCDRYPTIALVLVLSQSNTDSHGAKIEDMCRQD